MIKGKVVILHALDTIPEVELVPEKYAPPGCIYIVGDQEKYTIGQTDQKKEEYYAKLELENEALQTELDELKRIAYGDSDYL